MNSKASNTPSSSDLNNIEVHGENKSKPNSANTIGTVKYVDCQDGAYNMLLEEKLPSKEYNRDDILDIERTPSSKIPVLCRGIEKSGNSSSTKPPLYPRQRTNESRLGAQERSTSSQPGNRSKKKGQAVDDRKELIKAAVSAHTARQQTCSGPLWERMETVFAPITTEDVVRLKQPRHADVLNAIQSMVSDERVKNILMKASARTEQRVLEKGLGSSATIFSRSGIARTIRTVPSLFQRTLSAIIDEDEIEHLEGIQSEHIAEVNLQSKDIRMDGVSENNIIQSELDGHMIIPSSFNTCEQCQAADGSCLIHEFRNCKGLEIVMPPKVQMPPTSSVDHDYQDLSVDDRLLLELQSLGFNPEMQPHPEDTEGQIQQEIKELQKRVHQQAPTVDNELTKIEKAIEHEQGLEKRATEGVAFDKLIEIAYQKMPLRGRITQPSTRLRSNTSTKKDLEFVERTLQRCKEFENTGRSCFSDPNLQAAMFPASPCTIDKENIQQNGLIIGSTSLTEVGKRRRGRPSASTSNFGVTIEKKKQKTGRVQSVVKPPSTETEDGNITQSGGLNTLLPGKVQVVSQLSELFSKQDLTLSKGKEKVDGGMLRGASEIISEQGGGVELKKVTPRWDTGSCFSNPNLQAAMFPAPPCTTDKENIQQNGLILGSTSLTEVGKRRRGRPSASTSNFGATIEKKKQKTGRVQSVVKPPSTETKGGNITQSGGLNTRLPGKVQVVFQLSELFSKQDLTLSKGKEKVDGGMLRGALEIISERGGGVELKKVTPRRDTWRSCFSGPNLQAAMFPAAPCKTNKENIQHNSLTLGSTSLTGVCKRRKGRPSASTSNFNFGVKVEKNKQKTGRVHILVKPPSTETEGGNSVQTVVKPPSTETEGGNIAQSGGLNMRLPDKVQFVSQLSDIVSKQGLTLSKGKEKVDGGMLSGASGIKSGGVELKKVTPRRYRKQTTTRTSTLLSNSSSVVAPINTEEYLTGTHKPPASSSTVPQKMVKCGEASAARVKKVDDFFSKDFERLCMEPDCDILLQTTSHPSELDGVNGDVGKPEDLKTFIDFLEEDPALDFTWPLDVPMDDLFDVDAALAKKGW